MLFPYSIQPYHFFDLVFMCVLCFGMETIPNVDDDGLCFWIVYGPSLLSSSSSLTYDDHSQTVFSCVCVFEKAKN